MVPLLKKFPKINDKCFFHSVSDFVVKKDETLIKKITIAAIIQNGGLKFKWHQMVIFYLISDWNDTYQANYILFLDLLVERNTTGKIQDGVKIQNDVENPKNLSFGAKWPISNEF
jgi:hypothetical protein